MNWEALQRSRLARIILWPLSLIYGVVILARVRAYARGQLKPHRLRGAVVSVGNLTVGGVGKTPMVLWLAEKFLAQGRRVAVLSRGYRGARGASDEIDLLRERLGDRVQFGVGADRFSTGSALEARQPIDVFLLDDGFQHLQLARDVNILLMDASRSLSKENLLPAGLLREPLSAMSRADILIFTRAETQPGITAAVTNLQSYPVFAASTKLLGFRHFGDTAIALQSIEQIGAGPFFAFCGIGNPQAFFRDLDAWQVPIAAQKTFRDHHHYTASDARAISRAAESANARALVTTEKDAKNLAGISIEKFPIYIAIIDIEISQEQDLLSLISAKLQARNGTAS
jgi:tetraacyldisaccharide 4'-kinase